MNRRVVPVCAVAVLAVASLVIWQTTGARGSARSTAVEGVPDSEGIAHLNAIDESLFIASDSDEAVERITEALVSATFEKLVSSNIGVPEPEELAKLLGHRVGMLVGEDDYEAYKSHVLSLIGSENEKRLAESTFGDQRRWHGTGSAFRGSQLVPDIVQVERLTSEEVTGRGFHPGGFTATQKDPGIYMSAALVEQEAPIVRVKIPAKYSFNFKGKVQRCEGYYQFVFVWDSKSGQWLPYSAGFHNPDSRPRALLGPWI